MLTVNAVEVQKHRLKGPVGYTVVGSPTITDGIVSGFKYVSGDTSQQNYLRIYQKVIIGEEFEQVYKFKLDSSLFNINNNYSNLSLTGIKQYFYFNNSGNFSSAAIEAEFGATRPSCSIAGILVDTWMWLRIIGDSNGIIHVFTSTDGINYSNERTSDWSSVLGGQIDEYCYLGFRWNTGGFPGQLDLNETYSKVNGKLWFYQPADTKYIVKDGKLVWADPRLALSGPVNYSVVGRPMVADGVVSGFSGSDFLRLNQIFSVSEGIDFEIFTKIKTPQEIANEEYECFIFGIGYDGVGYGSGLKMNNSKKLSFSFYKLGSFETANTLSLDTEYYIKAGRSEGVTYLAYSTDNINWTITEGTSTQRMNNAISGDVLPAFGRALQFSQSRPWLGSIDLNETYIKVNNQLWFYGKNYATQNIAPVPAGYTFGTTTTPSIGYVDMRTQEFTAAPSGATIGRDE